MALLIKFKEEDWETPQNPRRISHDITEERRGEKASGKRRGGEERRGEKRRGEGRGWRRKHLQLLSMLLHLLYWVHKYVRAKAVSVASLLTWNTLIILQLEITPITHCIITLGDNTHKGPAICINKNSRGFNIKKLSFIKLQTPVCFTCWTYVSLSPHPPPPPPWLAAYSTAFKTSVLKNFSRSHQGIITKRPTKCNLKLLALSLIFLLEQWFRKKVKTLQVTQTCDGVWGKERKGKGQNTEKRSYLIKVFCFVLSLSMQEPPISVKNSVMESQAEIGT